jgi:hypothetical protein
MDGHCLECGMPLDPESVLEGKEVCMECDINDEEE